MVRIANTGSMGMKPNIDSKVVLAVVLCLLVFAGEYFTYYSDIHEYRASATWGEGTVEYSVYSSGSDAYSAVLTETGGFHSVDWLTILVDEDYDSLYGEASLITGVSYVDQQHYAVEFIEALGLRGFSDVGVSSSEDLPEYINGTLGNPKGHGLLVMTYALPVSVYDGTSDCPLLKWVSGGGSLYWIGSEVCSLYKEGGNLVKVDGSQELLFGRDCMNRSDEYLADTVVDNGFTDALCLKNSGLNFALDVSGVEDSLAMGYSKGGYSTVSFVGYGVGQICVIGGEACVNQTDDLGQIIASGLSHASELIEVQKGVVTRGEHTSVMDVPSDAASLYVYTGGFYTNFGEDFHVGA